MIWFACKYRKIRKTDFDFLKQVYILKAIDLANLKLLHMERIKQFCKNWAKNREKELPKEKGDTDTSKRVTN